MPPLREALAPGDFEKLFSGVDEMVSIHQPLHIEMTKRLQHPDSNTGFGDLFAGGSVVDASGLRVVQSWHPS